MSEFKGTPGEWHIGGKEKCTIYDKFGQRIANTFEGVMVTQRSDRECAANAKIMCASKDLLEALQAYRDASAMSNYGDASDFVWPKQTMRVEGDPVWGYVCEKHGLGYSGGCICCRGDFDRYKDEKDRQARAARNDALTAADEKASAAIAKALGEAAC